MCLVRKSLGATLHEVNIQDAVRVHFRDIGHSEEKHDVTYENAQARERTQVLMDIANQTGGMVIGTGDMSELALGWATYNGDLYVDVRGKFFCAEDTGSTPCAILCRYL